MTTTMSEHHGAIKRALECDDNDDDDSGNGVPESMESDSKKPKLQPSLPLSPPLTPSQNSREVKDIRGWELLPAVVYELLTLIKKSETLDPDDGRDAQKKNTTEEINEETKVLPNSNNQNEIFDIEIKKENLKESDGIEEIVDEKPYIKLLNPEESIKLLTSDKDTVKNVEELNLPANKTEIINVKMETTLTTEITDINIESVPKVYQKKDETNQTEDASETLTLAKNISINNVGNNISKLENLIMFSKKKDLLNLLKNCCFNGISKIPTSKPYPCSCKYCLYVSKLPKDQWAVNNLFISDSSNLTNCNSNVKPASSSMYVSDCLVCGNNDCYCVDNSNSEKKPKIVETSKNAWIEDLVSLIKKNNMLKDLENNTNDSKSLKPIKNHEIVTEQIKSHLPLCEICKKSKNPNSMSICKCNYTHHAKRKRFSDIPTINNGYGYTNSKNRSL